MRAFAAALDSLLGEKMNIFGTAPKKGKSRTIPDGSSNKPILVQSDCLRYRDSFGPVADGQRSLLGPFATDNVCRLVFV